MPQVSEGRIPGPGRAGPVQEVPSRLNAGIQLPTYPTFPLPQVLQIPLPHNSFLPATAAPIALPSTSLPSPASPSRSYLPSYSPLPPSLPTLPSQDQVGSTECTLCPAGTFSQPGSAYCIPCSKGSYTDTAGEAQCTLCPAGMFNDAEGNLDMEQVNHHHI